MAAQAARTLQLVRPHIAMIKFPPRTSAELAYTGAVSQMVSSSSHRATGSAPLPSLGLAESYQKQIGNTQRGSGIEPSFLPPRLQRRPLDDIEVEYINRGGPE